MQKLTIYLFAVLFFVSCGGNSYKAGEQDAKITREETTIEEQAGQNEKADKEQYLTKGSEIATATQAELLKVVQGAMASGGPGYAVGYCNIEALDLEDKNTGILPINRSRK